MLISCDDGLLGWALITRPRPCEHLVGTDGGHIGQSGHSDPVHPGPGSLQETLEFPFRVGSHLEPGMAQGCLVSMYSRSWAV